MNYQETIDYLFTMLPMYQRIGPQAFKKDLTNTISLCSFLGNPQHQFKSIHIAGTNGKGSVSHIIAATLMKAGYKTGLYTSPHLLDFRERIRVDGKSVSEEFVIGFTKKIKPIIEEIKPSFFEITVAMAFYAFELEKVDFAVIETGLGGRLDSTNVVIPEISVITNISLEHENMLGDTIEKIAYEKAGIIKKHIPIIIGEKQSDSKKVFDQIAKEREAPIYYAEDLFSYIFDGVKTDLAQFTIVKKNDHAYECKTDLLGDYQGQNIITSETAFQILEESEKLIIGSASVDALPEIKKLTGLRGRWEIIQQNPKVICDISHNPVAVQNMLKQLKYQDFDQLHIVLGMSNDKKTYKILSQFIEEAEYYFVRPDVPRGMLAHELKKAAHSLNLKGDDYSTVKAGVQKAQKNAAKNDLILITGSAFVVAEALKFF